MLNHDEKLQRQLITNHSGRVSAKINTLSPCLAPSDNKPRPIASIRAQASRYVVN